MGPPPELFEFFSYGRSKGTKMWIARQCTFPAKKNFRPGKNRKVLRGVPPQRLRPAEAAVSATVSAKSQIHGTHASLTAPPWSHGSMGHPGRAPQRFKKKDARVPRVSGFAHRDGRRDGRSRARGWVRHLRRNPDLDREGSIEGEYRYPMVFLESP